MVSKKIIRTLLTAAVIFLVICGAAAGFYFGLAYVLSQNNRFSILEAEARAAAVLHVELVTIKTPGAVELILPIGPDTQDIADILKQKGVIENTFVFTLLSKFNGFDGTYVSGTHYVTKTMSYDEIMYVLSRQPSSVSVVFGPGLAYVEVKAKLRIAGVQFDEAKMDSIVNNPQLFLDYDFITDIELDPNRTWLLQGYLFPDTYQFDVNTDEETIIRTFLDNTQSKLKEEYYARAAVIGMSMDDVITLASIIQNECILTDDMRDTSCVFHNRLTKGWNLESCATVNYLRKELNIPVVLWDTSETAVTFDSPYNTYNYGSLPPGPICSPGEDAIRAALWPSDENYLYFCAGNDERNIYTNSYNEQQSNVAKYKRLAEEAAAAAAAAAQATTAG